MIDLFLSLPYIRHDLYKFKYTWGVPPAGNGDNLISPLSVSLSPQDLSNESLNRWRELSFALVGKKNDTNKRTLLRKETIVELELNNFFDILEGWRTKKETKEESIG